MRACFDDELTLQKIYKYKKRVTSFLYLFHYLFVLILQSLQTVNKKKPEQVNNKLRMNLENEINIQIPKAEWIRIIQI